MGLFRLGGRFILRTNSSKYDLTSVHIKEYSTPTAPGDERNTWSHRAMTYVFAAPDFNRSAGSVGESVGTGSSRTLGEQNEFTVIDWEWVEKPFRTRVALSEVLWVRLFVVNIAVVPICIPREWRSPCPQL